MSSIESALLAFDFLQSAGTVAIALITFFWSMFSRRAENREAQRRVIHEACDGVDVNFAVSFFADRVYVEGNGVVRVLTEGDYAAIMNTTVLFPSVAWQRTCRSQLERLLESLRPPALVVGSGQSDFALVGPTDPVASRLRMTLKAMCAFWSPQGELRSPCTDDHRKFLQLAYAEGDEAEWGLLLQTLSRLGLDGRLGPVKREPSQAALHTGGVSNSS